MMKYVDNRFLSYQFAILTGAAQIEYRLAVFLAIERPLVINLKPTRVNSLEMDTITRAVSKVDYKIVVIITVAIQFAEIEKRLFCGGTIDTKSIVRKCRIHIQNVFHRIVLAIVGERGGVNNVVVIVCHVIGSPIVIHNENSQYNRTPIHTNIRFFDILFEERIVARRQQHYNGSQDHKKGF
jgi:hypothetical protein